MGVNDQSGPVDGDVAWLLARLGVALPHDGPIDAVDAVDALLVSEEALADAIARELETQVCDLESIDAEAVALLPEDVARACIALPVGVVGAVLQVAFANPLDPRAVQAVVNATERPVRPLAAHLTPLRRAIDREYGGALIPESSLRKRAELTAESTQRLGASVQSELPSSHTAPVFRMESSATMEQRFEALLLALVERGSVTREEYTDALRRILSR